MDLYLFHGYSDGGYHMELRRADSAFICWYHLHIHTSVWLKVPLLPEATCGPTLSIPTAMGVFSYVHATCTHPAEHMACWTSVQHLYTSCDVSVRLFQLACITSCLVHFVCDISWPAMFSHILMSHVDYVGHVHANASWSAYALTQAHLTMPCIRLVVLSMLK